MILVIGGAYQGKKEYVKENFGAENSVLFDYHLTVKQQLSEGKNPLEEAEKLLENHQDVIIVSDEIGYGLVPMDVFERKYREEAGRVNCYFASKAEQVIRVVCGIGNRIK